MTHPFLVPMFFLGLAVIFLGLAVHDFLDKEAKLTPARQTWIRLAWIFAVVGMGLTVYQTLFS